MDGSAIATIIWLFVMIFFWRWIIGFALLATLSDYLEDFLRGRR